MRRAHKFQIGKEEGDKQQNTERQQRQRQNKNNDEKADLRDRLFHSSFGQEMNEKEEETIRIATLNLHTFPISGRDGCKHDVFKNEMKVNVKDQSAYVKDYITTETSNSVHNSLPSKIIDIQGTKVKRLSL